MGLLRSVLWIPGVTPSPQKKKAKDKTPGKSPWAEAWDNWELCEDDSKDDWELQGDDGECIGEDMHTSKLHTHTPFL